MGFQMRTTLFGYGKTTKAIAKTIENCVIFDDKIKIETFDEYENKLLPADKFDPKKSDLEITSPGIPPSHPLIKKARNLISEYDFFSDMMPFSVWISGTNGKTTTTAMTGHLLENKKAQTGGNIGTPLADMDPSSPLWILETSSFTLHYTKKAVPNLYLLLPIKPDHISWHESFREYEKAKLKPLLNMKEGEAAIIPAKYADFPTDAFKITYENSSDLADFLDIDINRINFKEPFLLDAVMALGVTKILFDEIDYEKINSFVIAPHKLEEFYDHKNRLWINDSKATNIDAAIEALKRYRDKKIYLILGGDDKGVDLTRLFEFLKPVDVEIFAIGSNAKKIERLSKEINKKIHLCHHLQTAVKEIDKLLKPDHIALLSPAAASLDQFASYAKRGEVFLQTIKDLSQSST